MKHGDIVTYEGRKAEVFDSYMKNGKEILVLEFLEEIENRAAVDGTLHMRSSLSSRQDRFSAVPASETRLFTDSKKAHSSIEIRCYR